MQWMGPCYAVNEAISRDNLFEKALSGHPLILDVSADKASANRSSWNDVPRLWTAGVPMTFSLTLSDKFGNVISTYSDRLDLVDISRVFSHVRSRC